MNRAELELTADLALIDLDEARMNAFEANVGELLDHLALMTAFDVSGLEPTTHALQSRNRLREDVCAHGQELADRILEQSPDLEDRFISIPNVL
jgi:aspartyl-tRNA(Asn)/glutamyl-tRNA(Gln) amidotransferase subunit C